MKLSQALGVVVYLLTAASSSLVTCFLACGICALVSGCPKWERPRCENPGAFSCPGNHPHYCAPSQELTRVSHYKTMESGGIPNIRVCRLAIDWLETNASDLKGKVPV